MRKVIVRERPLTQNLKELRRFMDELSLRVWNDYRDGCVLDLVPGEESVTDRNLLELKRHFPNLGVRRLNKQLERRVGADWEWWIGSRDDGWLSMRVQAKRIYTTGYKALIHGGDEDDDHQYDTLIRTCDEDGFFAYHVFYNGWEQSRFDRRGKRLDLEALHDNRYWPYLENPREADIENEQEGVIHVIEEEPIVWWGCAALSSHRVAQLHSAKERRTFAPRYLQYSMPWSQLFNFARSGWSAFPDGTTASVLDKLHMRLIRDLELAKPADSGSRESRAWYPENQEELSERRIRYLPAYAERALADLAGVEHFEELFNEWEIRPARVVVIDLDRFRNSATG